MSKRSYSTADPSYGTAHLRAALKRPRSAPRPSATARARSVVRMLPRKKVSGLSPALARGVRALIQNSKEQKINVDLIAGGSFTVIGTTEDTTPTGPNFYPLAPALALGDGGSGNRIGSDINLTAAELKFTVRADWDTAGALKPQLVTCMIGRLQGSTDDPTDNDYVKLLQGSGATQGLRSMNYNDNQLPINDDEWKIVWRKTYKVGESNAAASTLTNNDFNMAYQESVNLMPFFKKKIKYNGANTVPSNEQLYVFWFAQTYDGTAISTFAPSFAACVTHRFTDA